MYSYSDFERLFVRYKADAVPAGISIRKFCDSNNVPYNLFEKWYRDTRSKIVPVQVIGNDTENKKQGQVIESTITCTSGVRILADIRISNGIHIHQKNLSYSSLKQLVEKLEALC